MDIREATIERGPGEGGGMEGGEMTMANVIADAEDFNTRYGSLVGFQEAVRRIKPIPRAAAQFDLSLAVVAAGAKTTAEAVDYLLLRLLRVPLDAEVRDRADRVPGTAARHRRPRPCRRAIRSGRCGWSHT